MNEFLGVGLGLLFGLTWTRHLGRVIAALVEQPHRRTALVTTGLMHLLPVVALLVLMASWSLALAGAALAGYWCGRTAWLTYAVSGYAKGG